MAADQFNRAPAGHRATAAAIKAEIQMLQAEIAKLEALVAGRQTEFWAASERERPERLLADLLRMTADLMSAREATARLEGELTALRHQRSSRPWWWRMLAG
jgi:hypothetical protein